jgi:FkbM family methyltransferase
MKKIFYFFTRILSAIIGRKKTEQLLIYSAKSIGVNLHLHGLIQVGGWSDYNSQINGESFFIEHILPDLCNPDTEPVFFDVGANVGDYSIELRKHFAGAQIHSFEPVKKTFKLLAKNTGACQLSLHNIGFSDETGTGILFNTVNDTQTEMASVYKNVFAEVFKKENEIGAIEFKMDTIDNFCATDNIAHIDFLKIDVEGHEFSVLKGAAGMLANKQIKVIQFEFNAHNVYSRVFLRDFYLVLNDFEFYRLSGNGIIKLGPYSSYNEIFLLQNILAVRKDITHLIKAKPLIFSY